MQGTPKHQTIAWGFQLQEARRADCWRFDVILDTIDMYQASSSEQMLRLRTTSDGRIMYEFMQGREPSSTGAKGQLQQRIRQTRPADLALWLPDTSASEAFSRISSWAKLCLTVHAACTTPDLYFVPRWLAHVGSWEGRTEPHLLEPTLSCDYVTLSYRYGVNTDQISVTATARIESYRAAIKHASLPATLQDAITFCRGIGAALKCVAFVMGLPRGSPRVPTFKVSAWM